MGRGTVFYIKSILFPVFTLSGKLPLSTNHTLTEYEMSGEPYSQKSIWMNHSNERNLYISIHSVVHVLHVPAMANIAQSLIGDALQWRIQRGFKGFAPSPLLNIL